jgi:nitrous oxide reductase
MNRHGHSISDQGEIMSREHSNDETPIQGIGRRRFLKTAGLTAASGAVAASIPGAVLAAPGNGFSIPAGFQGNGLWRKVRQAFVLDPRTVYMNVGTTGSMPRHVLENYNRFNRLVARDP